MRRPFNLDLVNLDKFTFLIHGGYGWGKTHLLADALHSEAQRGPVKFWNIMGEDGERSAGGFGLGEIGEHLETIKDYEDAAAELIKAPVRALGVDSLKALCRLVMRKQVGEERPPEKSEYIGVHWEMERLSQLLRRCAAIVVCTCPTDLSVDQITGKTMKTPDLPGREAVGSAGWFDFVGFLQADTVGPNQVQRTLVMTPRANIVTRQRLPRPMPDVVVPQGNGGWQKILEEMAKALVKPTQQEKKTK